MRARTTLTLFALVFALAAALGSGPALAKTHPGQLDGSFGAHGKALVAFPSESSVSVGAKYELPFEFLPGRIQMALAPDDDIVVASSTKIARLLPNGKPDSGFGSGGSLALDRPAASSSPSPAWRSTHKGV